MIDDIDWFLLIFVDIVFCKLRIGISDRLKYILIKYCYVYFFENDSVCSEFLNIFLMVIRYLIF